MHLPFSPPSILSLTVLLFVLPQPLSSWILRQPSTPTLQLTATPPSLQASTTDAYKIATSLLEELLLDKPTKENRAHIESLVQELCQRKDNSYNPEESLFGPLYESLYWFQSEDEEPIWERISLKSDNIKGQQYFRNDQGLPSVINYGEIWGRFAYIQVQGTLERIRSSRQDESSSSSSLFSFEKFLSSISQEQSCPDTYNVTVLGGDLHLGGLSIPVPIRGASQLVVLYADPRLRVFLSPMESSSVVGNWEEAGLVVVQVRSDLVEGSSAVDLRESLL